MKIAYIYTSLLTVGGVDRILTSKANYLADKMGYDVYIITDSQKGRPTTFPVSPNVHHIDLGIDFDRQYRHSLPVRFAYYIVLMRLYKKRLAKILDEIDPQIIDTTLGRDMDFITSLKRRGRIIIGEIHIAKRFMRNFHLMIERGGVSAMVAKYWNRKQERHISKLDKLVVLTNDDAKAWEGIVKTHVIPNFSPVYPASISLKPMGKRAISVGRYEEQKSFDRLILAWAIVHEKHPDWRIDIFGQGTLEGQLRALIAEKHLEGIVNLNKVTSNIQEEYEKSDFFVLSSYYEGFGLVLVEAMACGIPCVSFDCPNGPRDIINNNVDGLLVKNGDIEALAEGINYMIENPERRMAMGKAARENVKRYSIDSIMAQWDEFFKSLVNKQTN